MNLPLNQVVVGDCVEVMRTWPADSIDLVVTSPPYWGLRDYGSETVRVWGGDSECQHEWNEYIFPKRGHPGDKSTLVGTQIAPLSKSIGGTTTNTCVKCGAWRGSLGLEPHPQLFIDHLTEICGDIKRVLKPSGTFFLNLGDTYYGGPYRGSETIGTSRKEVAPPFKGPPKNLRSNWLQPKQKLMIPSRVAIALQHDGWILRSDIIWHKPNAMPSSVKDRLTCVHEHVFLFAKQRRYYFDLDAIRQPVQKSDYKDYTGKLVIAERSKQLLDNRDQLGKPNHLIGKNPGDVLSGSKYLEQSNAHSLRIKGGHTGDYTHPRGKNPGDLWRIPTKPFPAAHFATFPPALIEPIVKAGSPRWICSKCGKPRERILEEGLSFKDKEIQKAELSETRYASEEAHNPHSLAFRRQAYRKLGLEGPPPKKTVGWSDCGCGESFDPGVILDPFCGSGTALRVARRLGRRFIGIDIVPEYVEMARRRIRGDKYREPPEGVTPLTQNMEAESNG